MNILAQAFSSGYVQALLVATQLGGEPMCHR